MLFHWRLAALRVVGAVAIIFGLLTLRAGGNMLFGDRTAHSGPVVPFVLWFNFIAAFAYVAAGVGLVLRRRWSAAASIAIAVATAIVFAAFGVHVALGGAYATRTVGALAVRTAFWVGVAWFARVALRERR